MRPDRYVVGIDLGTTHTALAWARALDDAPQVFEVPQLVTAHDVAARPLLPSALYAPLADEGVTDPWGEPAKSWVVGTYASRRGREAPGRVIASAKSWLCHPGVDRGAAILPWGHETADEVARLSPVAASARILGHLQRAWDGAHPERPLAAQYVVLTVPASFDQVARELTLRAAHEAGLEVRLLEEPQAAFYDHLAHQGTAELGRLAAERGSALVLVCDVGGGTTDLTLVRAAHEAGRLTLARVAVGRHLLLGGDNMDLALAHLVERQLGEGAGLDPERFAALTLACHDAKERLLSADAPDSLRVAIAGRGAALVGGTLSATLVREEVVSTVVEGFFPRAAREAQPRRGRSALVAFGLPFETDPAITHHVAAFFSRHAGSDARPDALLLNGGVFRAAGITERLIEVVRGWSERELAVLPLEAPDLAVARGAVAYGQAVLGGRPTIGGGSPHGYYVALADPAAPGRRRALCVVPRGAREGEVHVAARHPLALRVGEPVRFELLAVDAEVHQPGEVVELDDEAIGSLPPITTTFEADGTDDRRVFLEGELSPTGTLDLACVSDAGGARQRYALAFDLRAAAPTRRPSQVPGSRRTSVPEAALEAIERTFGKGRADVKPREIKDLWRTLEKVLGERSTWTMETTRALFDTLAPHGRARRRSPEHERVFWMLAGFCLRPGFGDPRDPGRVGQLVPLFAEGVVHAQEARAWQQLFIAWRRIAGGLPAEVQEQLRDWLDLYLAPPEAKLKRPKGPKPLAPDELLELAAWLERVEPRRRATLGGWLLERTWTSRDPRLWSAIGRIGARVPVYASVHHVVTPKVVERWLDHLLRERWSEVSSAARAAFDLARMTGDRARDLDARLREQVAERLTATATPPEWALGVREVLEVREAERAGWFGDDLPVGLRLLEAT